MPKMKTKSLAKKRFSTTASGKIKRGSAYRRHLLTRKSNKRKRQLRGADYVAEGDMKNIKLLLPYS